MIFKPIISLFRSSSILREKSYGNLDYFFL